MAHVELLDPFGTVLAEGELIVRADGGAHLADQEFAAHIAGRTLVIETPDAPHPNARYSLKVA